MPIVADLTKEEDLKRAVAEAIEKLGGLDILINKYAPFALLRRGALNTLDSFYQ